MFISFRIPDGLTAEDRILAVLEFYLTSFHAGRKVRKLVPLIAASIQCTAVHLKPFVAQINLIHSDSSCCALIEVYLHSCERKSY